jgi:hypothetical protein
MAWNWRDSRHRVEVEADLRYAAARTVRAVEASRKLDAVLAAGISEGKRVSKLAEMADRIAAKKVAHDAKADEWAARLDALDKREPEAFAIGDAVVVEREADLGEMEKTMRAISNLPNVGVSTPSGGSSKG